MSTFQVSVVRIRAIEPIPDADQIELAVVGDYRSVVGKGQFQSGDLAIYLPEASILTEELVEKLGLTGKLAGPEKNRVKAIRLRGCISQGILMAPGLVYDADYLTEGQDLAEILCVAKYEPLIPAHMQGEVTNMFGRTLHFDVENFKAWPDVIKDNELVEFSEKVHGTFCAVAQYKDLNHPEMVETDTLIYSKGLGGKGLVFKDNEANVNNLYVRTIKEYDIPGRIRRFHSEIPMTILGEVYGAGGFAL